LEALRRLSLVGRFVGEAGPKAAPGVFAKEREAKMAKIGKAALANAMRQLFEERKIRLEEYRIPGGRTINRIVET
jgi:hypothetical protein